MITANGMQRVKKSFTCQECGSTFPKWFGQCTACEAWNSLIEEIPQTTTNKFASYAGQTAGELTKLSDVTVTHEQRIQTESSELDRVLGGGLIPGSVVLIGGDPGIGKSTVLIQTLCKLSQQYPCLYVTGEESLQQITLRARRLHLPEDKLELLAETQVERIIEITKKVKPTMMVIDSIQTIHTELIQSAPGAVGQVRESAAQLVRYAKQNNVILFLVGHVTKEGTLAGPRVLEHMVDTVLYFEGQSDNRYRVIRAVKNRFGAVNEIGVFGMTDKGLKDISNPSAIFLTRDAEQVAGSCVMVTWEGTRPLLVEVQALVDQSYIANPRRVTIGLDHNRLAMLLAVLHKHGGISSYDQDVFINVVGGVKVTETAIDLALVLAVMSSLKNKPLPKDLIVFGEVGLAGEIRPVQSGQERIKEAAKHGFKTAIIPKANAPQKTINQMQLISVTTLTEVLNAISSLVS